MSSLYFPNQQHYHVSSASGEVILPPLVTQFYEVAVTEYNDRIRLIQDNTGASIGDTMSGRTYMGNGDWVSLKTCCAACIDSKEVEYA